MGINKYLDCAINYLMHTDFTKMDAGKYPVDGDQVFALVQAPKTYFRKQGKWESHKDYIDIQYMLVGEESIGFQKTDILAEIGPYRMENDITFYSENGKGFFPQLIPDSFVICFPSDAHMPLVCMENPQHIKKVVMKVRADLTLD